MALVLLDTHAFLWWLADDAKLGTAAREVIGDPATVVYVSAATAWEIAVKREAGRLVAPGNVARWISDNDFAELPITVEHAVAAAELPKHHRDPFDRMLVAQARVEDLTLVSHDEAVAKYSVSLLDAAA